MIGRSSAAEALEPAPWVRERYPTRERHEPSDHKSQWLCTTAGGMPDDKGRITEEPCAIKVARTVLEQRWME